MLRHHILKRSLLRVVRLDRSCSDSSKDSSNVKKSADDEKTEISATKDPEEEDTFVLPPEPDNCCMSGCANCVWIQYAKDLTDLYQDSGGTVRAKKIILEKIKDPTMQVFIKMELSSLSGIKK